MSKKKKTNAKAFVAAGIVALGVYGTSIIVKERNEIKNPSEYHLMETTINDELNQENENIIDSINLGNREFFEIKSNNLFTLLKGVQLYQIQSDNNTLYPSKINDETIVVRGFKTNGEVTLIELNDGNMYYVYNDDIVKVVNLFNSNGFSESKTNPDMSVNKDSYVYNNNGVCEGYLEKGCRCIQVSSNGEYSLILLDNNESYFIKNEDLTLTADYNKSIFPITEMQKDSSIIDNSIRENEFNYMYRVNIFDTEFKPVHEETYSTILKGTPIYYKNGSPNTISFTNGVKVKVLEENEEVSYVEFDDGTRAYVSKRALCGCLNLNMNSFKEVTEIKSVITNDWDYFYDETGAYQNSIYPSTKCTAISTNGEYTLVELENGKKGYLRNDNLLPSLNQVKRFAYLKPGTQTYYYDQDDQFVKMEVIGNEGRITFISHIDGEYAYAGEEYYRETYYVKTSDVDFSYNITPVNQYGYVSSDTLLNSKIDNTGTNSGVDDFELLLIEYNCGEYSFVRKIGSYEYGYIKTSELQYLEGKFIYIDLDKQEITCYDDNNGEYYTNKVWGTRSGNDSSPSHEGAFDIDWKAKDWEFTTFRGSYAKYWIPYNEYGEGIHDLVGDDEQNYGNEAYHGYGSHGCVRVPREASEYVYNNYEEGQMVLVNKK